MQEYQWNKSKMFIHSLHNNYVTSRNQKVFPPINVIITWVCLIFGHFDKLNTEINGFIAWPAIIIFFLFYIDPRNVEKTPSERSWVDIQPIRETQLVTKWWCLRPLQVLRFTPPVAHWKWMLPCLHFTYQSGKVVFVKSLSWQSG